MNLQVAHSGHWQARPEVSGCTTAGSISAGNAVHSADMQQSLNSGSIERGQQASDRRSGLSADEVTRLESLERYREKKRRRLYTKTIRYHKRKVNADARKRYKGRFVKAGEDISMLEKEDSQQNTEPPPDYSQQHSLCASDLHTV